MNFDAPPLIIEVEGFDVEVLKQSENIADPTRGGQHLYDEHLIVYVHNTGKNVFCPNENEFVFGIVRLKSETECSFQLNGLSDVIALGPETQLIGIGLWEEFLNDVFGIWLTIGVSDHEEDFSHEYLLHSYGQT